MDHLGYSISHTSRRPRVNETDGMDYYFVDRKTFQKMIKEGAFVEWAEVYHELYGTSYEGLDRQRARGLDVLLDLDSQGAKNIKEHYEDSTLIYLLPPSLEVLEKRLKDRSSDDEDVIKERMSEASMEIKNCAWFDYVVVNEDLGRAIEEVQTIIVSNRCRTIHRLPRIKETYDLPLS